MRRVVLALAMTVGLAIGTITPVSALGDTSVTLSCNDGTSVKLVVDADTLTGLTQAVQAMINYPAGLSCTLIQNPLGVTFGQIAFASAGQNPFIVGGGRWQATVSCADLGFTEPPPPPPPTVFVGGGSVARVPGSWSYDPTASPSSQVILTTIWVNIAVNVHQQDNGTYVGTLNETIPTQRSEECGGTVTERHFTSKPICLQTFAGSPNRAVVTSDVTQVSGDPFPGAAFGQDINFSFEDNGNPGGGRPPDMLQGPPEIENSLCPAPALVSPDGTLVNGNISIRNPS